MREGWKLCQRWLGSVQRRRLTIVGEKPERSDIKGNAQEPKKPAGSGRKNPVVHQVGVNGVELKIK